MDVLVIEDEPQWAELLCALLAIHSHVPRVVGSLAVARCVVAERPWDLVLLDLRLPDSSMEETLREIPRLKALGASRVVVVTAVMVTPELAQVARAYEADDIIAKDCAQLGEYFKAKTHS